MEDLLSPGQKPKRALIARLYKNFSVGQFDKTNESIQPRQDSTILNVQQSSSMLSVFSDRNKLVPKVQIQKRLKPLEQHSSLPVMIQQGKILVTTGTNRSILSNSIHQGAQTSKILNQSLAARSITDQSIIHQSMDLTQANKLPFQKKGLDKIDKNNLSQSAQRFLTKEDEQAITKQDTTLETSTLAKGQTGQGQGQSQVLKQKLKEKRANYGKKPQKGNAKGGKKKDDKQQEYLTPMDFIHLIRTDPEMADEFCYLNKCGHPYDFKIVEFDERNPREYMTISARGITHFIDDEATFMTVEEWEREAKMFHQLLDIEFFKIYKKWKSFSLWKRLMRRNMMKECSQVLNQQLFSVDRNLGPALLKVREFCLMSQDIRYLELNIAEPFRFEEYKRSQENYRMSVTDVKLDTLENHIKDLVVDNCKKSLVTFKEENRIPIKNENEDDVGGANEEEQAPLLVGDETGKEMPYTQEATIRTHFKKLNKFVRLIDYLILDAKIAMIQNCTVSIHTQIDELNQLVIDAKKHYNNLSCWLIVEGSQKLGQLVYTPDRETLKKIFEEIVQKSVTRICSKHKLLVNLAELQQFIRSSDSASLGLDERGQSTDDSVDLLQIVTTDQSFKQAQENINVVLDTAFNVVEQESQFLTPFIKIYEENTNMDIKKYEKKENEFLKQQMVKLSEQDASFQALEPQKELGLILFDNNHLKDKIKNCSQICLQQIQQMLPELLFKRAKEFCETISALNLKIGFPPTTVEQFVKYQENVSEINNKMENISQEKAEIEELDLIMDEFKIKMREEIKQKAKDAYSQMKSLRQKLDEAVAQSDQNTTRFKKELDRMIPSIDLTQKDLQSRLEEIPYQKREAELGKTVDSIKVLSKELTELNQQAKKIRDWQLILGTEISMFEKLEVFSREFQMIEKLWSGRQEWQLKLEKWFAQHFSKVDMDEVALTIEKLSKTANLCAKELEANEVSRIFKQDVEKFKGMGLLLGSLRDPALSEEPWGKIRDVLINGGSARYEQWKQTPPFHDLADPMYTVGWIEKHGIVEWKEQIAEIALRAAKEAELVKMLKNVELFWTTAALTVVPYKDRTDVSILGNNEDLVSKIDDTMLTVNNILASRFVEGIRDKVEKQMKLFRYLQELLDEWMLHQRNWLYLEPILTSPYAQKNMVKEVKNFNNADGQWKRMMKTASDNPVASKFAQDYKQQNYIKLLKNNNLEFEKIQKALDELLEKKREAFQRFFFLSNDELLEILSQAKNLKAVMHHLRKCFENIVKLEFNALDVVEFMVSAEGEKVQLKNYMQKTDDVEVWFKDLEEAMKQALRIITRQASSKYDAEDMTRKIWVLMFPSQIVLSLDATFWTKITEENYLAPDASGDLQDWYEGNVGQLEELTELIRGELSDLHRKTVAALAVQDVHFRDIIDQLSQEGVDGIMDFKWQQQLRLYYEEDALHCRQVNSKLPYGYEYYGATTRLVITPLTDRCWMTITGALGIKLGANPAGPAGTGKTESCKDLAKILGKYCIVFNCSDQINVKMMEKLFAGLCYTGSWTCLDEFNRIGIEVLSVIAQQVLTIREALLEHRQSFNFFGKIVTFHVNAELGIFPTMNPGYAGRTELPDNLKTLFRPVAMMVPDYTLIAEIMLFAEGFSDAKGLSSKMTKLYKLSSEQLSQQDHYDFGMRAVKSVLVMAGALKRAEPNVSEDIVLIRAMRDSNVPKFLSHDIPLFNAIVQDLFPGKEIPPIQNEQLELVIKSTLEACNLRPVPSFVEKILQFHETLKVRFGVMIVGPTMGGKSTCLDTLRKSYITLADKIVKESDKGINLHREFQNILIQILNPKSISMEELYGDFDPLSQSWTDGLASTIMRNFANNESRDKKWVVFDGPVDALWIENMNSVLDDSQTLCLSNGERIKLKPQLRMLFEVLDLAVASPATVSRCGMVFIDEDVVGVKPIVSAYFDNELANYFPRREDRDTMLNNLLLFFRKAMSNIKKIMKQPITTMDQNLAIAICRNIKLVLELDTGARKALENSPETARKALEKLLLWAFAWGIGATLSKQTLDKFESQLIDIFSADICPKGSIYQYFFAFTRPEGDFVPWTDIVPNFAYTQDMSYFDLVVPTKDTVCYSWFIEKSVLLLFPLYITGTTGTGKTIIANSTIKKMIDDGIIASLSMTFSAKTAALATQLQIENRLQTQRKKGNTILMPPPGKKLVIFVDDINMPAVEQYGAQPPIELLRQYQDYKKFYDRKTLTTKEIESTVLIAASAPPGGGRSALTPRFSRHFNIMNVPDSSEEILMDIFSAIFRNFIKSRPFKKEIIELAENNSVVSATLSIYQQIQNELLPTPAKSHYIFNLRDVSKIFQGVLQARPLIILSSDSLVKLWVHETSRIFSDRLINDQDRLWFEDAVAKQLFLSFKIEWNKEELFRGKTPLVFGNFLKRGLDPDQRQYEEVKDIVTLTKIINDYMMEETKLNLVLFRDCIEHLSRLARVLSFQRGHAMLVGVGGSGKKSIIQMASALSTCLLDTVEPKKVYGKKEFKEDLYRMMKKVAFQNKQVVFMFVDTQILQESFLEDVNNLLNAGEVPNLLVKEELDEINNEMAQEAREKKTNDTYSLFVNKVRNNLHIVLAMSPIGPSLRVRMRMFPSIVNCCTIDWLNPWPEEALLTVAKMNLDNFEFDDLKAEQRAKLADCCMYVHQSVELQCEKFFQNLRRKVYITPKSYIDLIDAYKDLLKRKYEEISNSKNKLSNGLFKLKEANDIIVDLKAKLTELQPILAQKTIEIDILIKKLDLDSQEANKKKVIVEEEKRSVNEKAEEIQEMKNQADQVLQAALPMLQQANEALNILSRNVVSEIKANNNPNPLVLFTLECVNCLFEEKQDWDSIKKVLADPNLVSRMKNFDVYSIKEPVEKKIKAKIAGNPEFTPEKVEVKSQAAKAICQWVLAVANFTDVNKLIQSKQAAVNKLNAEFQKAQAELSGKVAELKKVTDQVEKLEKEYQESKTEKDRLDAEKQRTEERLVRAEQLTVGLADEQVRWKENVETLTTDLSLIVGNVFIAASSVSYYGPFTGTYRQELVDQWLAKCAEVEIACSEKYNIQNVLAHPVIIRDWNSKGLPSDSVSINNGILAFNCRSYPLLIDPQLQGSRWIKKLMEDKNIRVLKMSSPELLKTLEACIRMGMPLMIEDMEETLEAMLEPLLLKQFTIANRCKLVRLGDSDVEFDENFKLIIQTKLPNPNFLPEIFIRATIINFTVTQLGLEEQLLADVVKKEMPDVEYQKNELIMSIAKGKQDLKKNEDKILELLTSSKGMILDDVELIENLKLSKETATIVKEQIEVAEQKNVEIDKARLQYQPVAERGSVLYFVIADLALIDPMYQFSLSYFQRLFNIIIEQSAKAPTIEERVQILINQITYTIFINVCRGLFNDHKKIFSFLVASSIAIQKGTVSRMEWNVFNRGVAFPKDKPLPMPDHTKINEKVWNDLNKLRDAHANFETLPKSITENLKEWEQWIYSNPEPYLSPMPKSFASQVQLTPFQILMLIRIVKEEKTLYAMSFFVDQTLGKKFTQIAPPTMDDVFKDTDYRTPLIFILSQGADPLLGLLRFAKEMKISQDKLVVISLGQGQGPIAEKNIDISIKSGGWVVLQNCHLGKSFMPTLEKRIEGLENPELEYNPQFRLFLTSMPCDYFPVSILQNGVKLTNEPPKGIKANLQKTYGDISNERIEGCAKPEVWKKLLFSLSFFHAIVQERRKFGPLGWNIRYEFNDSDLDTAITILKNMLDSHQEIPWDALRYVIGEITYGGRVTDDKDRRTLMAILNNFVVEDVLEDNFSFSQSGNYVNPVVLSLDQYRAFVDKFPEYEQPEVFGMHDNANITFQLKESKNATETILSIQPRDVGSSGSGKSSDEIVADLCKMFEEKSPALLKKDTAASTVSSKKQSVVAQTQRDAQALSALAAQQTTIDSLQVCMQQECDRFNKLLGVIQRSLANLKKAIKGEVVMSAELDKAYSSLINNQVPDMWKSKAYPSLKPLASWFDDLISRIDFFRSWLTGEDKPKAFWISAFFFPQGFLTSVLQSYARANMIAIDKLGFSFKFLNMHDKENLVVASEHGAYIYGLYIEGCAFDAQKGFLDDSQPGVMFTKAPVIEFIPTEDYKPEPNEYSMPVYKTTVRAGTLSTTGHSTNFIISIETPTKKKPEYWILKGAAFACALND